MPQTSERPRARGPRPVIHYDPLHRYLWRRTDHLGHVVIKQGELGQQLGVSRDVMKRVTKDMRDSGRIRFIFWRGRMPVYQIADPATWVADDPRTHAIRRAAPAWG